MSKLVVANWKANISNFEVQVSQFQDLEICIAAPFPFIRDIPEGITKAAQDVSFYPPGSYTGEVTAEMLKEIGVKYCLVGHLERRKYFNEGRDIVLTKIRRLNENGIIPILCARNEEEVVDHSGIIMYEPETAISTPGNYHPEDTVAVAGIVNSWREKYKTKILYGGSVNSDNVLNYSQADGFVIGQASLDPRNFYELLCQIKT